MIVREVLIQDVLCEKAEFETQSSDRKGYGNAFIGSYKDESIENYANGTLILAGEGNNAVISIAGGVIIDSGDDEDYIISVGMGNDISAGGGNDVIYSQFSNNHIDKGTGADTVYVTGKFGITGLDEKKDDVADAITTPGLSYQYIKNQGLIYDPYYLKLYGLEQAEDAE